MTVETGDRGGLGAGRRRRRRRLAWGWWQLSCVGGGGVSQWVSGDVKLISTAWVSRKIFWRGGRSCWRKNSYAPHMLAPKNVLLLWVDSWRSALRRASSPRPSSAARRRHLPTFLTSRTIFHQARPCRRPCSLCSSPRALLLLFCSPAILSFVRYDIIRQQSSSTTSQATPEDFQDAVKHDWSRDAVEEAHWTWKGSRNYSSRPPAQHLAPVSHSSLNHGESSWSMEICSLHIDRY